MVHHFYINFFAKNIPSVLVGLLGPNVIFNRQQLAATLQLPFDLPLASAWNWMMELFSHWLLPQSRLPSQKSICSSLFPRRLYFVVFDTNSLHDDIRRDLRQHGLATFDSSRHDDPVKSTMTFRCDECSAFCTTSTGLASHQYQNHGTRAIERAFTPSDVCIGCLTDFRCASRLYQHLWYSYHPNCCWSRIFGAEQPADPITVTMPTHLRRTKRVRAVRRLAGPLRPTAYQRARLHVRRRLQDLHQQGTDIHAWYNLAVSTRSLGYQLISCTNIHQSFT